MAPRMCARDVLDTTDKDTLNDAKKEKKKPQEGERREQRWSARDAPWLPKIENILNDAKKMPEEKGRRK